MKIPMRAYKVLVYLLLVFILCEVTLEQATYRSALIRLCSDIKYDHSLAEAPALAEEDGNAINALLRCSRAMSSSGYAIRGVYTVNCDCYLESQTRCRVTDVDLSNNRFQCKIPEEIGDLAFLKTLDLHGNKFSGSIPVSFPKLKNLVNLSLSDNALQGQIQPFFLEMKSLKNLYLSKNSFNGIIPDKLDLLPSLETLDLGYNLLSGKIPDELGNIKTLTRLYLVDNQLTDVLPDQLRELTNLEELWLENNEFTGRLQPTVKSLEKLTYLNVRGNNFNDAIPDLIHQWQHLTVINLMGNNFSAPLADDISKLTNLHELYITDLVGENSSFPNLSGLISLRILTLRNCSIFDRIPGWISTLHKLEHLDLSFNHLYGVIPHDVSLSLTYIFLRGNMLNETNKLKEVMPSAWMNDKIFNVDISENRFTNMRINSKNPNLNLFACCQNVSKEDANFHNIDFRCSRSKLYDSFYINCGGESKWVNGNEYGADTDASGRSTYFWSETSNWGYSSMGTFLWAARNKYTVNDTCKVDVGDAKLYYTARVSPISLKYFGFCLRNGKYNVKLHFAEISSRANTALHGNARRLFDIDIQRINVRSKFSIEGEAGGLNKAVIVEHTASVDNGRLEIHLYWSGKGSVVYPSPYYGPLISAISVTIDQSTRVIATCSGAALCLLILLIGISWRYEDKNRQEEQERAELYPGGLYNYKKIKDATSNFGKDNCLGEGGFGTIYKGRILNGTEVAVKKLSARKEGMDEFLLKSRSLTGKKHPNVVRLMGSCAGKNQLLLIYEYIKNDSLEDALFGENALGPRLDWPSRFKICLGLAEGLAFLHKGCEQEIIHGDIRPENIFLDDDRNPKIYDFGFSRLYNKQKSEGAKYYTEAGEHRLASADVYSFGVVTLVLVSGRKVVIKDKQYTEYIVDEAVKMHQSGNLMKLVDETLSRNDVAEAEQVLILAMACILFRPTMPTVVKILKKEYSTDNILITASNPEVC